MFLLSAREGYFKERFISETYPCAVCQHTLVGSARHRFPYLKHETASSQVGYKWLHVISMTAATVEECAKPRTHGRLAVIARLGNDDMQDGGIDASVEITVGNRL